MKKAIIAASFGTTCKEAEEKSISALEKTFSDKFSEYEVRRAFTSPKVISVIRKRGERVDSLTEAMDRLISGKFEEVIVQPTHIIRGNEYDRLCADAERYRGSFSRMGIGVPLLSDDDSAGKVCSFIGKTFGEENAVLLMGHGTGHTANSIYAELGKNSAESGYDNIFIGTINGTPTVNDIIPQLKSRGYRSVVITPLLLVAGEHARSDMAGSKSDSTLSVLESEGFSVTPVIKGMGEFEEIRSFYAEHLESTIRGIYSEV